MRVMRDALVFACRSLRDTFASKQGFSVSRLARMCGLTARRAFKRHPVAE
ncbi:hypothetical protein U91I_01600 [alpha proteobacterium U9-1i]|nr:hypothetical protein U91I_01600 [alpha proteobacterium U9-1i]